MIYIYINIYKKCWDNLDENYGSKIKNDFLVKNLRVIVLTG